MGAQPFRIRFFESKYGEKEYIEVLVKGIFWD
jgi:hypothetical protein